jgi:hypothetical protein
MTAPRPSLAGALCSKAGCHNSSRLGGTSRRWCTDTSVSVNAVVPWSSASRLRRRWNRTNLLQQAQLVPVEPIFDDPAIHDPKGQNGAGSNVVTGRWNAHQRPPRRFKRSARHSVDNLPRTCDCIGSQLRPGSGSAGRDWPVLLDGRQLGNAAVALWC